MSNITQDARTQWLIRRRELVTASDVAAILGEDKHRDILHVYAEKLGLAESEETEEMARGRDAEEFIARAYQRQTGRKLIVKDPYEITIHRTLPWLGATIDRWIETVKVDIGTSSTHHIVEYYSYATLQLKLALGSGYEWRDDQVPKAYTCQVQIETACANKPFGAIAGFVGMGPLAVADLPRDEEFLQLAIPVLERFRWHVQNKVPPEPKSAQALDAVKKLWPRTTGETITVQGRKMFGHDYERPAALDGRCVACGETEHAHYESAAEMVDAWEYNQAVAKRHAETADYYKALLRARMQDAQFGDLGDGTYLERRITKRGETLRRERPRRR